MKYSVNQNFHTESTVDSLQAKEFSNKKEALSFFNEIKDDTKQGGQVETYIFNNHTEEEILSQWNDFDNPEDYGKLVIAFQHTGKGMNYSHKFLYLFWLDKNNIKNLSDNPDNQFQTWHYVLDLKKEDLNGGTFDEIIEKIKDEANLRLENYISLDGLELDIKEDYHEAIEKALIAHLEFIDYEECEDYTVATFDDRMEISRDESPDFRYSIYFNSVNKAMYDNGTMNFEIIDTSC